MARSGHFTIVFLVALCRASLATPPDDADRPSDSAVASPNQSISIDAEQGRDGHRQNEPGSEQQGAIHDNEATTAVPGAARPPIFLGRRPSPNDPTLATHAQTPWYRSSFGALGLVLGLLVFLYIGLRRWAPSLRVQDGGLIRILSRTAVGPRQSLMMVRVGQKLLLVGVSADRIERVCEIEDADEVAALTAQSAGGRQKGDFSAWLDRESAEYARTPADDNIAETGVRSDSARKSLTELLQKLKAVKV